uniref:Uncharacterized protein n=1 Tax=Varanus komodoensis TaxID=61221 RepID=A0A8D2L0X4_VARKO
MHEDKTRRAGHKDKLEGPEVDVRDVEEPRVAHKVMLATGPALSCHGVDEQTEEGHHRGPYTSRNCSVLVHTTHKFLQRGPAHPFMRAFSQDPLCGLGGEVL